jgi:hypothetical protein
MVRALIEGNLKKTADYFVDLLVSETIKIESLSGEEFLKYCEIWESRQRIWLELELHDLSFIRALEKTLKAPECRKKFPRSDFSMRDHILEDIKEAPFHIHGEASIDALVTEYPSEELGIEAAGRLAQHQDHASLTYFYKQYGNQSEFVAFLVLVFGECVFRQPKLLEEVCVKEFYQQHLAVDEYSLVPMHRTEIEYDVPLVDYARTSDSMSYQGLDYSELPKEQISFNSPPINKVKLKSVENIAGMDSAVAKWLEVSNGELVIRQYQSEIEHDDMNSLIHTALLQDEILLEGLESIKVQTLTHSMAFSSLFHAASGGGCAYCQMGNALDARKNAWKTFTAMMHLKLVDGFDSVYQDIENWDWFYVQAESDWFCQIMDDLWLVAVNQSKTRVSMLAATDTD